MKRPDPEKMARALREFLSGCGLDPEHGDLVTTPERVSRTWLAEFLDGYGKSPSEILNPPVLGESDPDLVIVAGLRFHAMCPHHLLPYRGLAHVAYVPAGKLAGFGRIAELVDCFAHRLTLQERITHQVAEALVEHLGAKGAGCILEATHLCLAVPGEKHDASQVQTSAFVGEMQSRPELQARLYEAARVGATHESA